MAPGEELPLREPSAGIDMMTEYYRREKHSLEKAAETGALEVSNALDGKLYFMPMDSTRFAIAVVTNGGMVIRNGDEIRMERGPKGDEKLFTTHTTRVSEFFINKEPGDLSFREDSVGTRIPANMGIRHAVENLSAHRRVVFAMREDAKA